MRKALLFITSLAALVLVAATPAQPQDTPQRGLPPAPTPPANISSSPDDSKPPEIHLPEDEQTPAEVQTARQMGAASSDVLTPGARQLEAHLAHEKGITGKGVKIAILDTGADLDHGDLKPRIVASRDWTGSPVGARDRNGHGTHCAGDAAAAKNDWGIYGVAYEADLIIAKVLSDAGSGRVDHIAAGIDWAVAQGADVISLSLGGPGTDRFIPAALERAEKAGVLIIAASGNDGNARPINFPGNYEQSHAIGAVDLQGRLANFSCTGDRLFAVADGVNSRSTWPGDRFANLSGTSMSTPKIAGAAALWVQADAAAGGTKDATRHQRWKDWVSKNSTDLGTSGRDRSFGWGLPKLGALSLGGGGPGPVVPPLPRIVTEADLTDAARARLGDVKFRIEIIK